MENSANLVLTEQGKGNPPTGYGAGLLRFVGGRGYLGENRSFVRERWRFIIVSLSEIVILLF
jgi:hypothetical protein